MLIFVRLIFVAAIDYGNILSRKFPDLQYDIKMIIYVEKMTQL